MSIFVVGDVVRMVTSGFVGFNGHWKRHPKGTILLILDEEEKSYYRVFSSEFCSVGMKRIGWDDPAFERIA